MDKPTVHYRGEAVVFAIEAAEKKFREATGLEGKLYLSPHVT